MRERESLAQLILGMSSLDREKWLAEHFGREESYPWQPRRILPERRKDKGFFCVEIMGLPESGKTSGYQHLLERLPESFPEIEIVGIPEFGEEQDRANTIRDLYDEFAQNVYLNFLKFASFQKGLNRITDLFLEDLSQQRSPGLKILLCERGIVDEATLIFRTKADEGLEREARELEKEILEIFLVGLAQTEMLVDVVVLYGVSLDTARQRREERGLPLEGRVTNGSVWPGFERSYSWWLGSFYPLLRQRRGTGLLVIDGEGKKEENNFALLNYVKEVAELVG